MSSTNRKSSLSKKINQPNSLEESRVKLGKSPFSNLKNSDSDLRAKQDSKYSLDDSNVKHPASVDHLSSASGSTLMWSHYNLQKRVMLWVSSKIF